MIILLSLGLVLIVCITWKQINGGIFLNIQLAVFSKKTSDWRRFLKILKSNKLVYYFTD